MGFGVFDEYFGVVGGLCFGDVLVRFPFERVWGVLCCPGDLGLVDGCLFLSWFGGLFGPGVVRGDCGLRVVDGFVGCGLFGSVGEVRRGFGGCGFNGGVSGGVGLGDCVWFFEPGFCVFRRGKRGFGVGVRIG